MYFYNAFQLSEDEGKSVLLLRLQNDCLRSLRTEFIFVRDLGPLEKPRELQVIRIISHLLSLSAAVGMAQNFTFAQLSTAGEQVPSCNITTPF